MTNAVNIAQSGSNNQTMRNRIINGAMTIAQRGTGSVTNDAAQNLYPVDRFGIYGSVSSRFTAQQNAGSVTPPAGYTNYVGCTSLASSTVGASELNILFQLIEGLNTADLAWGTASAQPVTLSFWVRSSLTGTFGGAIINNAYSRSYPFIFTISSANTWEYKTITIPGDTTGTWLTNNGIGVRVFFNLGSGSSVSATAGAWTGTSNIYAPTGATSVVGTNGATFYVTGVQFEEGTAASPFENRLIGTELALCQRYCIAQGGGSVAYGTATAGTSAFRCKLNQTVSLRASPSTTFSNMSVAVPGIAGAGLASIQTTYFQNGFVEYDIATSSSYGASLGQTAVIQGSGTFIVSAEL